jgi:hypothetical protein
LVRFIWTREKIEALVRQTLEGETAPAIAKKLGCIARTVQLKQIELDLRKAIARRNWTQQERDTVRELYPNTKTSKIAEQLGRAEHKVYQCAAKMGLKKSAEYLASPEACRLRRGDNIGARYRFVKGHAPSNKGLRRPGYAPGRMSETQFRKGERSGRANINWKPIGTILIDTDGYRRIKVRDAVYGKEPSGFGNVRVWPLLQRHVWEQYRGPIPAGHTVVFRDGDKANCDIENLEMISRGDLMRRNTIHNRYPKEIINAIMLLGAVKRKVREKSEERNHGSAQSSL